MEAKFREREREIKKSKQVGRERESSEFNWSRDAYQERGEGEGGFFRRQHDSKKKKKKTGRRKRKMGRSVGEGIDGHCDRQSWWKQRESS
jgi:hypothetical protein